MNDEQFMDQKLKDMTVEELANAIKIKTRRSKSVKPRPKFPLVFQDEANRKIEVDLNGSMTLINLTDKTRIFFEVSVSLPLLFEAVEKSKELKLKTKRR